MANATKKIGVSGVPYASGQHHFVGDTMARQELVTQSAQQNMVPDVSSRRNYHAPPRQIRDVWNTPNYVRGMFGAEDAYRSHGWNVAYNLRDPVTGGRVQRYHAPTGGEGEMLT